jgi:hypothetical protein
VRPVLRRRVGADGGAESSFAAISVPIAPGNTTLTWTFVSRSSAQSASVRSLTAALEAP